jgi:hypothetical protein
VENRFTYVWEFEVPAAADAEFQRAYGPSGHWATLFRRDAAHIETLLLQDKSRSDRYITIDRWKSEDAYRAFRERFRNEYETLDRACESLTSHEANLGEYWECREELHA